MSRPRKYANDAEAIRQNRNASARRSREKNDSIKEIGPLPPVVNSERRERCRDDLLTFMLTYGGTEEADSLYLFRSPFCEEQIHMIKTLEQVLKFGGEVPLCIFRGGCKTTICEWGALWSLAYGWQKFGVVVAASQGMARRIIANVKTLITSNPLLAEDFPEICYPIAALERVTQRAACQTLNGEPTEITFSADTIRLPKVQGAASSHGILVGVGAESSFRGLRIGSQRPTFVLIDDPQTNKSARSETQTTARWENITSSMKGLAGPGVDLAMVATITVFRKGDLAERILENWNGKRFGILRSMPTNMKAWDEYNEECQRIKRGVTNIPERNRLINAYYVEHREELDAGAEAAWESNFTPNETSAIQHAMHLYYFDRKAFWSEYMNLPVNEEEDAENLTLDDLERKIRPELKKGVVPVDAVKITAGIDVQETCLFWCVTAWGADFTGHVIDYGRFPKGGRTFDSYCPNKGLEEQISICLTDLAAELKDTTYYRDVNREPLSIDKVIVDANLGTVKEHVEKVCRRYRGWLEPTNGWGHGPDRRFFARAAAPGEERGPEWRKPALEVRGIVRIYTYNTNYWKSFVRQRIKSGIHARATLTFYAGDAIRHQRFFQHLLGECSSKLTGQYGTIDKWLLRPGEPNHWWDCLVMSTVAASACKIKLATDDGTDSTRVKKKAKFCRTF